MSPDAAQLTAAVAALINALVASKFSTSGVMGMLNKISYARWGLEGYVIAETNYLTGGCVAVTQRRCAQGVYSVVGWTQSVSRFNNPAGKM